MLKGRNGKEKAEYFWMYYKIPFLAILIVVFVSCYWVHAAVTEQKIEFTVMLVDSYGSACEEVMEKEFAEYAGIEASAVSFLHSYLFSDSSSGTYAMTSLSKFYADIGTASLDVCGFLEEDFQKYAGAECFLDLRKCLSEEELYAYGDNLFYEGDAPVGIYTEGLPGLKSHDCYTDTDTRAVIGIIYNSNHVDRGVSYLRYIS